MKYFKREYFTKRNIFNKKVAEWLKAIDCKSIEHCFYVGSNPTFFNNIMVNIFILFSIRYKIWNIIFKKIMFR